MKAIRRILKKLRRERAYTLKQDLAATEFVLGMAGLGMDLAVLLPELWVVFCRSTVDESNVELGLDTARTLKLTVEASFVAGYRGERSLKSFINTTLR